jgi:hypothetical protein
VLVPIRCWTRVEGWSCEVWLTALGDGRAGERRRCEEEEEWLRRELVLGITGVIRCMDDGLVHMQLTRGMSSEVGRTRCRAVVGKGMN